MTIVYDALKPVFFFDGEYRFLSNFYPAEVEYEGLTFPSVEHAYQAAKTLDIEVRKQFLNITPGQAKRLGKQVKSRDDWDSVKVSIMHELVGKKFKIKQLRDELLATGNRYLIEGNTWGDTFWGVCNGVGKNMLGIILMEIRNELVLDCFCL